MNEEMIQLGQGIAARVQPGNGEKVLWIHGYTIDSSLWRELWECLPDWYHIGLDLPGHGLSEPWPPNPTLPSLARLIGELALAQGVRHLVALSFGTVIALQIVLEFPGQFASLTLGAPAIGGGPQEMAVGERYKEMMQLYFQRGAGPWLTELWMRFPPDTFRGAAAHPVLWQALIEVINRHSWLELKTGAMRYLPYHVHSMEMLRQIQTPVLVLVGDEEMAAFKETAVILAREVPHCQRVEISSTGHLCMLESPQATHGLIAQHLRAYAQP